VAKVKKEAQSTAQLQGKEYIIVDGSPGIGCPVISSLSGADLVLLVTEPTLSGLNDLKRVWELTKRFQIPACCIINKADLNSRITQKILYYLEEEGIQHLTSINYDRDFQKAITQGISLIELDREKWEPLFKQMWEKIG
jgi:MinD superfamily P-loop ATPase